MCVYARFLSFSLSFVLNKLIFSLRSTYIPSLPLYFIISMFFFFDRGGSAPSYLFSPLSTCGFLSGYQNNNIVHLCCLFEQAIAFCMCKKKVSGH